MNVEDGAGPGRLSRWLRRGAGVRDARRRMCIIYASLGRSDRATRGVSRAAATAPTITSRWYRQRGSLARRARSDHPACGRGDYVAYRDRRRRWLRRLRPNCARPRTWREDVSDGFLTSERCRASQYHGRARCDRTVPIDRRTPPQEQLRQAGLRRHGPLWPPISVARSPTSIHFDEQSGELAVAKSLSTPSDLTQRRARYHTSCQSIEPA